MLKDMDVLLLDRDGVTRHRVRSGERIRARWAADELDRRLAGGAAPESDVLLAVRARWLLMPARRADLATGLRRLADGSSRVPVDRAAVSPRAPMLRRLAERLAGEEPVPVAAMARIWMLLTDGTGPLYRPGSSLDAPLAAALAAADH